MYYILAYKCLTSYSIYLYLLHVSRTQYYMDKAIRSQRRKYCNNRGWYKAKYPQELFCSYKVMTVIYQNKTKAADIYGISLIQSLVRVGYVNYW